MKYSGKYLLLFSIFTLLFTAGFVSAQNKDAVVSIKANLMIVNNKEEFVEIKPEDLKILENDVEQKISKFSKKDSVNLGIVVDNSGSMRTQIETILGTATLLAENLRGNDEAFLVRFVGRNNIELVNAWTSDKDILKKGIKKMFIEGGQSAVSDAIKVSAEKLVGKKDSSKRNAIVLISDCEDRDSYYTSEQVLKFLKENDIELFIIGFTRELEDSGSINTRSPRQKATNFGNYMASNTGGAAYFPNFSKKNQEELIKAVREIVFSLHSQYIVEYTSTNSDPKDDKRKISVEVADSPEGEKRLVFVRSTINNQ